LTPLVPTGTLRQVRVTTLATWAIAALFVGVTVPGAGDAYAMYVVSYSLLPWAAAVSLSLPLPWAVSLMAIVLSGFALPHALLGGPPVADAVAGQVYMVTAAALGATSITLRHRALRTAFLTDRELQRSEREVAASQLALIEQQALHDARNHFLERMSHELRTPLNAILGYTEILMEEMSNDGQQGDLHRIQSAGLHLLGLIDDVLDLSKIEAGRMDLELGSVDVGEVVRRVVGDHEQRARIAVHVEPGVSSVVADAARVGQIVRSLLCIALELPGSQRVVVRVGPGERQGVRLTVHGEGAHMDASVRARLLRPFASPDPAQEAGSAGLGLVVSRHFAALMGGEVRMGEDGGLTLDLVEV
ncbi:MAG: HAMP domain-containing histidine kinase, partial [Myxococcales bacterium]|nr:HAMP domain-containing histidine kinase [Myxococcales bacterium]